ncbi:MAG: hypothetical protein C4345_05850 [Chloroflexota bacterium]
MSYYAAGRALMLGLDPVPMQRLGDHMLAIGGVRDVGNEITIYVRSDAVLVRISAVAPFGDPSVDATTNAWDILAYLNNASVTTPVTAPDALLPTLADLPLRFVVTADGWRSLNEIADTFLPSPGRSGAGIDFVRLPDQSLPLLCCPSRQVTTPERDNVDRGQLACVRHQ